MKTMMNFTTSEDDVKRYQNAKDLKSFYSGFGLSGLELMPLGAAPSGLITPDMVIGVHLRCIEDWMDMDTESLIAHYRQDLDFAEKIGAEYVVFHVSQSAFPEALGEPFRHTDAEVVSAAARLINQLLDNQKYTFWFLMENMWYPGLNYLNPEISRILLNSVYYEKKGLMLDTGHFLHTNLELTTQKEAVDYLQNMLDDHTEILPYMKGIHLQQSLTGAYVKEYLKNRPPVETDPDKLFTQAFLHIFQIDKHLPFTEKSVKKLVERINPLYLTFEYITDSRETHAEYLKQGTQALL